MPNAFSGWRMKAGRCHISVDRNGTLPWFRKYCGVDSDQGLEDSVTGFQCRLYQLLTIRSPACLPPGPSVSSKIEIIRIYNAECCEDKIETTHAKFLEWCLTHELIFKKWLNSLQIFLVQRWQRSKKSYVEKYLNCSNVQWVWAIN